MDALGKIDCRLRGKKDLRDTQLRGKHPPFYFKMHKSAFRTTATPAASVCTQPAQHSYTSFRRPARPFQSPNSLSFDLIQQAVAVSSQTEALSVAAPDCPTPRKSVSRRTSLSRPRESITKHIAFSPSELEDEDLIQLISPFPIRRIRDKPDIVAGQKDRQENLRLRVQLMSEVTGEAVFFRCYKEEEVVRDEQLRGRVTEGDCDDDCQTEDEQVEDAQKSLKDSLVRAIRREAKRKGKNRKH